MQGCPGALERVQCDLYQTVARESCQQTETGNAWSFASRSQRRRRGSAWIWTYPGVLKHGSVVFAAIARHALAPSAVAVLPAGRSAAGQLLDKAKVGHPTWGSS